MLPYFISLILTLQVFSTGEILSSDFWVQTFSTWDLDNPLWVESNLVNEACSILRAGSENGFNVNNSPLGTVATQLETELDNLLAGLPTEFSGIFEGVLSDFSVCGNFFEDSGRHCQYAFEDQCPDRQKGSLTRFPASPFDYTGSRRVDHLFVLAKMLLFNMAKGPVTPLIFELLDSVCDGNTITIGTLNASDYEINPVETVFSSTRFSPASLVSFIQQSLLDRCSGNCLKGDEGLEFGSFCCSMSIFLEKVLPRIQQLVVDFAGPVGVSVAVVDELFKMIKMILRAMASQYKRLNDAFEDFSCSKSSNDYCGAMELAFLFGQDFTEEDNLTLEGMVELLSEVLSSTGGCLVEMGVAFAEGRSHCNTQDPSMSTCWQTGGLLKRISELAPARQCCLIKYQEVFETILIPSKRDIIVIQAAVEAFIENVSETISTATGADINTATSGFEVENAVEHYNQFRNFFCTSFTSDGCQARPASIFSTFCPEACPAFSRYAGFIPNQSTEFCTSTFANEFILNSNNCAAKNSMFTDEDIREMEATDLFSGIEKRVGELCVANSEVESCEVDSSLFNKL